MKIKLRRGFTDIKIEGAYEYSPFMPGDEVDVKKVVQTCSDRGCCELAYHAVSPDWNEGKEFVGYKSYDKTEVDIDEWNIDYDKTTSTLTYYPPDNT